MGAAKSTTKMPSTTENPASPKGSPPSAIPDLRDRLPKLQPRRRQAPPSNPLPLPETPELPSPPDLSTLTFKKPSRRILSPKDHDPFLASPTYKLVVGFVFSLTESVVDTPVSAIRDGDLSPAVKTILQILDKVQDVVERSPPEEQGDSRFGNKGFRDFLDLVRNSAVLPWSWTRAPAGASVEIWGHRGQYRS